jgi:hypothetical protein
MEIQFADTFAKSLKRLASRERWFWKTWEFFRYDLKRFFRNLWLFRKDLYNYRWYGGQHAVLPFMRTAISDIAENVDKRGNEVRHSAEKKIKMMHRASWIMQRFIDDDFVDLAENEIGQTLPHRKFEFEETEDGKFRLVDNETDEEKELSRKIFDRSRELEEELWKELWTILEGQDYKKFKEAPEGTDYDKVHDHWQKQFDGSGLRGWWD